MLTCYFGEFLSEVMEGADSVLISEYEDSVTRLADNKITFFNFI